jgi:hypothetical protein
VAKYIKLERAKARISAPSFFAHDACGLGQRSGVLFLQARRLNVPALPIGGEKPTVPLAMAPNRISRSALTRTVSGTRRRARPYFSVQHLLPTKAHTARITITGG